MFVIYDATYATLRSIENAMLTNHHPFGYESTERRY